MAELTAGGSPNTGDGTLHTERVSLRADLAEPSVMVPPGETVTVALQVMNPSTIIETVNVELVGLMAESVSISPRELTLFPEESAEVELTLGFHRSLPAGDHEGLILVAGVTDQLAPAMIPLTVQVPPGPAVAIEAEPPVKAGGRKASFDLLLANEGNTPLTMQVRAADADRVLAIVVSDPTVDLLVDGSEAVTIVARRRRPMTGPPIEHVITIEAEGGGLLQTAEVRFRQKPRLTAGVITLLTLASIVALWALAMVFGVQAALAPTPPTKSLPETFSAGVGLADLDPTVVGGSLAGTISASTTAQPLARATVEAFDQRGRLVAATATGDDGVFELTGLLPVRHRLRISAPGFEPQWWPGVSIAGAATPILVSPDTASEGIDTRLVGAASALGGQAIAGDGEILPITVEVAALDLLGGGAPITVTADDRGVWSVPALSAPATYRITYRAEGYAPVEITQPLDAGQQVVVNTTRLPAAPGSINGIVLDPAGLPLGGVELLAQRGETAIAFTTPTAGEVGIFALEDLETPATYLLTFVAPGYASVTRAVRLGPGEALADLEVALSPATGIVQGRAVSAAGEALGGVHVTVSGGGVVFETETLTSGSVGTFRVAGLALPGVYAVTFDLAGHARQTIRLELAPGESQAVAEVTMASSLGEIVGRVFDDASGVALGAVVVEVSDGLVVRSTTTASLPVVDRGSFRIGGLAPGSYTVTAILPGGRTVTILETVDAGEVRFVALRVGAEG